MREIELQNKLAELCGTHDRTLLSNQLYDRLQLLIRPPTRQPQPRESFPIFPSSCAIPLAQPLPQPKISTLEIEQGYLPLVPRSSIEPMIDNLDSQSTIAWGAKGYL
jgi:hypothetical protein